MGHTILNKKFKFRSVFISDIHLGFHGCNADLLLSFLRHVECEYLYLVGDIIDIWSLKRKRYWPQNHNNVVRTTLQATAAVLGGTQSLHTNSRDEALALPNEDSALLALRTQQIIAFESGVADVVDPLAGSYFVEELTDTLEKESFKLIEKIDSLGGAVEAIEQNFQQTKIADSAYDFQKDIDAKEKIQVGVNKFITEKIPYNNIQKIDQKAVEQQIKNLTKFKNNRDNGSVVNSLNNLKQAAENGSNIFPLIIESVKANATLGEISNTLRDVFGEHKG